MAIVWHCRASAATELRWPHTSYCGSRQVCGIAEIERNKYYAAAEQQWAMQTLKVLYECLHLAFTPQIAPKCQGGKFAASSNFLGHKFIQRPGIKNCCMNVFICQPRPKLLTDEDIQFCGIPSYNVSLAKSVVQRVHNFDTQIQQIYFLFIQHSTCSKLSYEVPKNKKISYVIEIARSVM